MVRVSAGKGGSNAHATGASSTPPANGCNPANASTGKPARQRRDQNVSAAMHKVPTSAVATPTATGPLGHRANGPMGNREAAAKSCGQTRQYSAPPAPSGAATPRPPDAVDAILAQWRRNCPDLDASPMGPIGRINRCAVLCCCSGGWVKSLPNSALERRPNPADARSSLVQLTPQGLELIDRAVEAHVAKEHRILSDLKAADIAALDARRALLLTSQESRRGQ